MTDGPKGGQRQGHSFGVDLAHDFGGALLFSFPLLMTMEMWWLGFYMDRFRLALFLLLAFVVVVGLSYFEGPEEALSIEVLDALVACAAGYTVAAVMLLLFGIIKPGMSTDEVVGKISLHAVPSSIGAILARKQLDVDETRKESRRREGYGAKIFLMGVGAVFLAFQLAPTEEMVLIGHMMTGWHAAALAVVSLCVMQVFICSTERGRRGSIFSADFFWGVFLRFTAVGYALALLISLYVLWTFGRLDGAAAGEIIMATLVLGFPAALGASAARLIL
ncbi:MAG TPA: TIGR02587 family membrane protein [Pyrinomonadaceae bacterium]